MSCLSLWIQFTKAVLQPATALGCGATAEPGLGGKWVMLYTVVRKLFTGVVGLLRRGARRLKVFLTCTRKNGGKQAEKLQFCDGFMLTGNCAVITPRNLDIKKTGARKTHASWCDTYVSARVAWIFAGLVRAQILSKDFFRL